MERYLWLVFLLILVFLLVRNAQGVKQVVNSLSAANTSAISALQGRGVSGVG